jgi:hypothetical protein
LGKKKPTLTLTGVTQFIDMVSKNVWKIFLSEITMSRALILCM